MVSVTSAYSAAQTATSSQPNYKVYALLRNMASRSEGSTATASSYFDASASGNYPAWGAIDNDATHINAGSVGMADNGIGQGTWKSASLSTVTSISTAGAWNAASISGAVILQGDTAGAGTWAAVAQSFATSIYETTFDGFTNTLSMAQDGWTITADGAAFGAYPTTTAAQGGSRYGIKFWHAAGGAVAADTYDKSVTVSFGNTVTVSFNFYVNGQGYSHTSDFWYFALADTAGTDRYAFQYNGTRNVLINGANTDSNYRVILQEWHHVDAVLDRTDVANTVMKTFVDGREISSVTATSLNIAKLRFVGQANTTTSNIEVWLDNLRVGSQKSGYAFAESVIDRGAQAKSGHGWVGYSATCMSVSSVIAGAVYGFGNMDTLCSRTLYNSATETAQFQTFKATDYSQLDVMRLFVYTNAPASVSNLYVEIRPCVGANPDTAGSCIARSRLIYANNMTEQFGDYHFNADFSFPLPVVLNTATTYAAVILPVYSGYTSGGARMYIDTVGTYADGSFGWGSDAGWTVQAGSDMCFAAYSSHYSATENTASTQDTDFELLGSTASAYCSQSFQVSCGAELRHVWLWMKMHNAAAIATGTAYWIELQEDDGTGKPDNTIISRTRPQEATQINWTAYRWQCLTFPEAQTLTASHTYHLVLKADYNVSAVNHLDIGYDGSAAGYSGGQMCIGTEGMAGPRRIPTWTATATSDLCFKVMRHSRAYVRTSIASGAVSTTYGSYSPVIEGGWGPTTRAERGNMPDGNYWTATSFTFTASTPERYWHYKHELISPPGVPVSPVLVSASITDRDNAPQYLYVDMQQERLIDRIEIYGHPTDGGIHQVEVAYAPATAVYVTIGAADYLPNTLEGRKSGGGGSASWDTVASCFHVDGQYLGFILSSQTTMRYIRVAVYGSESGYAHIAEIRARMVQDFSSRVLSLQVKRESDMVYRRTRASTLNMNLNNSDGALHSLRTDVNTWSGQLGAGCSYLVYAGYEGAADAVRQGQFYSDGWTENGATVQVTARDAQKLLGQKVRPAYRQNQRADQLVEYLGNLCGIPSVDMVLDVSPAVVSYFAPDEIDAFEHVNLLAESTGWGREYVSEDGYVTLRSIGNSAHNLGTEDTGTAWGGVIARTDGPATQAGDHIYWATEKAATTTSNTSWNVTVVNYNTVSRVATASTWTGLTNSSAEPGVVLAKLDGNLYAVMQSGVVVCNPVGVSGNLCTLGSTSRVACIPSAVTPFAVDPANYSIVDGVLYTDLLTLDLMTLQATTGTQIIGQVGDWLVSRDGLAGTFDLDRMGLAKTSIIQTILWQKVPPDGYPWVFPESHTYGNVVTSDDRLLSYGIACATSSSITGDATVIEARFTCSTGYGYAATATTVCAWGDGKASFNFGTVSSTRDCMCLAWANGVISVGYGKRNADNTGSYRRGTYDEKTNIQNDTDGIGAGAVGVRLWVPIEHGGQKWIYGGSGYTQMFESSVGRMEPTQDDPVATFTNKDVLLGLSIKGLDGSGGENTIINEVVVKSAPLYAGDTATAWQKEALLWPCVTGVRIQHPIELNGIYEAPQSITALFAGGGAGTAYINGTLGSVVHHKQPTLSIVPSAAGFVGAITVNARKMEKKGGIVSISFGPSTSINRYGLRKITVENDYIYDTFSQGLIAASIISRYANPRVILTNVEAMAMWNLRLFDRIHVTDSESGVDNDFLVAGINTDYLTQKMQLTLIMVEVVA